VSARAGTIHEGREHDEATEVIQDEFAATGHGAEASERRAILQVCFAGESIRVSGEAR
jgi:hypothetical protein